MSKRKLILVVGPNGSGKTTLVEALASMSNEFEIGISSTTRSPRVGEVLNRDYYFLTDEEFLSKEMIESVFFNDKRYGFQRSELDRIPIEKDILLVVEPNGALEIGKYVKENELDIEVLIIYMDIPDKFIRINLEKEFLSESIEELKNLRDQADIQELNDKISSIKSDISERMARGSIKEDMIALEPQLKKIGLDISLRVKVLNEKTASSVFEWYTFYKKMYA